MTTQHTQIAEVKENDVFKLKGGTTTVVSIQKDYYGPGKDCVVSTMKYSSEPFYTEYNDFISFLKEENASKVN